MGFVAHTNTKMESDRAFRKRVSKVSQELKFAFPVYSVAHFPANHLRYQQSKPVCLKY